MAQRALAVPVARRAPCRQAAHRGLGSHQQQVLFSQFVAGNAGTSGFAGNGGGAYSYQLRTPPACTKGSEDRSWDLDVYNDEGRMRAELQRLPVHWCPAVAAQATVVAVPGAAVCLLGVLTEANSPTGVRQGIGYTMQGGAG